MKLSENGVGFVLNIHCAEGVQPVEVTITYWGELLASPDPFADLGAAWSKMIPAECKQQYEKIRQALTRTASLMIERATLQGFAHHDFASVANCWQNWFSQIEQFPVVARQLLQQTPSIQSLSCQWAVAMCGTDTEIADYLDHLPFPQWHWGNQLWFLRRAIHGETKVWKFLWDYLPDLSSRLHEDASLVALCLGLGSSGSDRAWLTVEPLITHSSSSVRSAAFEAISQLKETRAREALRIALNAENENTVRSSVISALGEVGEEQDAAMLIDVAFKQPQWRPTVQNALAKMGTTALSEIATALRDAFDATLREMLVGSLLEMNLPDAAPILSEIILRDKTQRVRLKATIALRQLGYPECILGLIYALADESEQVRNESREALIEQGETAVGELLDWLANPAWRPEHRYAAQWGAARALARIGGETVKQRLMELAESYDHNQRWAALTAIRDADYSDLSEWIVRHIPNSPWTVQHECAVYLWRHPHLCAVVPVMETLNNAAPIMQEIFDEVVVAVGVEAIQVIRENFDQWDAFPQRQSIVRILQRIAHPAGHELLETLSTDPDERIRTNAREALRQISAGME